MDRVRVRAPPACMAPHRRAWLLTGMQATPLLLTGVQATPLPGPCSTDVCWAGMCTPGSTNCHGTTSYRQLGSGLDYSAARVSASYVSALGHSSTLN